MDNPATSPNGRTLLTLTQYKPIAYRMRKDNPHMARGHCFEAIAKEHGFNTWSAMVAYCKERGLDDRNKE